MRQLWKLTAVVVVLTLGVLFPFLRAHREYTGDPFWVASRLRRIYRQQDARVRL